MAPDLAPIPRLGLTLRTLTRVRIDLRYRAATSVGAAVRGRGPVRGTLTRSVGARSARGTCLEVVRTRHVPDVANRTLGVEERLRVVVEKASAEPRTFGRGAGDAPPSGRPDRPWIGRRGCPSSRGALVADHDEAAYDVARDRLHRNREAEQGGRKVDGGDREPGPAACGRTRAGSPRGRRDHRLDVADRASDWLRLDLPKRLECKHHVTVTTVTARPASR